MGGKALTICDICYTRRTEPPFAEACAVVPVRVFQTRPGQQLHACDDCAVFHLDADLVEVER